MPAVFHQKSGVQLQLATIADGSTRRQFWQSRAVPQDQAGSLTWAQFKQTMLLAFGQQNLATTGRDALFAVKQGSRSVNKYVTEWRSKLADIPEEVQPNQQDLMYQFSKGLCPNLRTLTKVIFETMQP